jgi:hypothetical protein
MLAAMIITSCGSSIVTSDELVMINKGMTLEKANELYEPYFDEENVIKTKVNGKNYTIITLLRITSTEKKTYQATTTGQTMGYDSRGNPTMQSGLVTETRTRRDDKYTSFYLIFQEQNYLFSGYAYEAKISHISPLLNQLIDFTLNEVEEE